MAALLVVGSAIAVQLDGLPEFGGEDDPGAVTLPRDVDPEERPFPDPSEATDAEGNPRCHTATVVVDCVSWSVTVEGTSLVRFVRRLDDRRLLAFGEPNVIALVDVDEPAVRWTYDAGRVFGPSVVADGTLVLEDAGTLTGIDLATGAVRWEHDDLDGDGEQPDARRRLRLLTGEDRQGVFIAVDGPERDRALRIDASDGTTRWEQPLEADEDLQLVAGTLLAATQQPMPDDTAGGAVRGRSPATVRSLDLDTGQTRWSVEGQLTSPYPAVLSDPGASSGSPIVLQAAGRVQAIDPTSGAASLDVAGVAGVASEDTFVVRHDVGHLAAYDVESGELRWRAEFDAPTDDVRSDDLVVHDGHLVVRADTASGYETMLAVFDLATGELRYRFDRGDGATMTLADGDTATISAPNLAGWSIREGSLAAVHQRGPQRTLWLIDLDDQQLQALAVDDQREHPSLTDDLVVLLGAPAPTFRHRDDLEQAWRTTAGGSATIWIDPLLIVDGNTLHAFELPAPSP